MIIHNRQSILNEIARIDPIPKELEALKSTLEKVVIEENTDLPECKNKFSQLNTPYSEVVNKYKNELTVLLFSYLIIQIGEEAFVAKWNSKLYC